MRRLLAREDGIALPVALSALAIVSLVAAMTAGGAVELSRVSTDDRSSKRALAAAEAGLNVATYRVNRFTKQTPTLLDSQCVAYAPQAPVSGECQPTSSELGNGTRYTYRATPKVLPGDPNACPTQVPGPAPPAGGGERCVTSVGEADGVVRRVQARLSNISQRIFQIDGMIGVEGIKTNNEVTVNSLLGSNGQVTFNGTGTVGDVSLGPNAPDIVKSISVTTGTVTRQAEQFVLPKLDAEFAGSWSYNNNLALGGLSAQANTATPGWTGAAPTWSPGNRTLTLAPNSTVTLPGGTYNLCRLALPKNAKIYVATGDSAKLFLDSPDRDATCASATQPPLLVASGAQINNPGNPIDMQIYIYGRNNGTEAITINHAGTLSAAIYAPQTSLKFASSVNLIGAVIARYLEFSNSATAVWDPDLADLVTGGKTYERSAWSECRPEPATVGDAESGC